MHAQRAYIIPFLKCKCVSLSSDLVFVCLAIVTNEITKLCVIRFLESTGEL